MNAAVTDRIPNTYLRQFFRFLGSRDALLEGTVETPASLAQLDGSNSFRDYCRFFRNAREQLERPEIGLVLGRVNQLANMHGPVSTVLFHSLDIRDCLQLLARFTPLRLPVLELHLVEQDDCIGLRLAFSRSAGEVQIPVTETLMLSITGVIAALSQGNVRPECIELDYPRPAYAHQYREAFGAASFRFSRPALQLLVNRSAADYRIGTDTDPDLRAAAIRRCEALLRGVLGARTTSDRIRQIFADNPGHLWTLKDIAGHLSVSERTLQRRLAAENISYQRLHDRWLRGEARQLLGEKNLAIESVALLLGYSDVSNFRHACRRWFGCSPHDYRQNLRAARIEAG